MTKPAMASAYMEKKNGKKITEYARGKKTRGQKQNRRGVTGG